MSRWASWNEDEHMALYGLSMMARVVYLMGIRWRMDRKTGLVGGPGRTLSYAALAEMADFIPDKGSQDARYKPNKEKLRAVIRELKRAGLIEDAGSSMANGLIFRCILADRDQSVQNMNPTGTPRCEPHCGYLDNDIDFNGLDECEPAGTTHEPHTMNPTPQYINTTYSVAQHRDNSPRARVDQPERAALVQTFAELGFAMTSVHNPKVMGMIERWCSSGVSPNDVKAVVTMLRDRGKQFTPAYLDGPVMDYLERKHSPSPGGRHEASQRLRSSRAGGHDPFWDMLLGPQPDSGLPG